jgi:hypothetical protein
MNQFCRKACNFCGKDSTSLPPRVQPQPQQQPPQSSRRIEQKERKRRPIERVGQVFYFHTEQAAKEAGFNFYD